MPRFCNHFARCMCTLPRSSAMEGISTRILICRSQNSIIIMPILNCIETEIEFNQLIYNQKKENQYEINLMNFALIEFSILISISIFRVRMQEFAFFRIWLFLLPFISRNSLSRFIIMNIINILHVEHEICVFSFFPGLLTFTIFSV